MERRVPWGPRDAFVGMGLFLVIFFLLLSIAGGIAVSVGEKTEGAYYVLAAGLIVMDVVVVGMVRWLTARRGATWEHLGLRLPDGPLQSWVRSWFPGVGRGPQQALSTAATVLLALAALWLVSATYGVIVEVTDADLLKPREQIESNTFDYAGPLVLLGIAVVLFAPVAEEMLFRGLIFRGLRNPWGYWGAALASGFLFAAMHSLSYWSLGFLIPLTAVGMIIAFTYEKTGSLIAPVSLHMTFNLVSFVALLLLPEYR